ncbi:MAG: ABC transporter substrate-binding protein [Variibacter sp.]|nr:ABC transporter substrate-binding protein [Variibacter sp.]
MGFGVIRHGLRTLAVAVALALTPLCAPPAPAQTPLRLTLDGRIEGPSAPFLVALERGHFKAEGLEVTLEASSGALEPIARVASGAYDIGFGDINALIRYRDQNPNAPVQAVFVVNNRPNYAIIGRKSRGVEAVRDLVGKKLGAPVADPASAAWPILAHLRDVDLSKVTVIDVGLPVREPMLAAGEVDAITGSSSSSPINLRAKGVPADDIVVLLMAERGLELYGGTIFVNTRALSEKPEAVRAFLSAFVRGLKDTLRDPAAAVESVVRRNNTAARDVELERLRVAIRDSVVTPEVIANGLGGIDPDRFARALDQIGLVYSYKNRPKPEDIFDPSFLPPESERKLD